MIVALLIFLAWGSHLNSVGYRLLHLESFFKKRSFCPSCNTMIAWYDNIPIFSWFYLHGKCRQCMQPISWLYPFIEIITTIVLWLLYTCVPCHYFPTYFIFFSALIVTIRTDFQEMLISRFATLYLIPIGLFAATTGWLPISLITSIVGSAFGYFLLWTAKKISFQILQKDGVGQGDLELLAMIGAFTGPIGCWFALTIGSCLGSIASFVIMYKTHQRNPLIPFGPYLSFGAIIYVLYQSHIIHYILN